MKSRYSLCWFQKIKNSLNTRVGTANKVYLIRPVIFSGR